MRLLSNCIILQDYNEIKRREKHGAKICQNEICFKTSFGQKISANMFEYFILGQTLLRVSEANEVPISSQIWVASMTFKRL